MINYWLQSALSSAGLTQADLAKRLSEALSRSVDRAAVNKMISGERRILADEMIETSRICSFPLPQFGKSFSEYDRAVLAIQSSINKEMPFQMNRKLLDEDIVQIRLSRLTDLLANGLVEDGIESKTASKTAKKIVSQVASLATGTQVFLVE